MKLDLRHALFADARHFRPTALPTCSRARTLNGRIVRPISGIDWLLFGVVTLSAGHSEPGEPATGIERHPDETPGRQFTLEVAS